MGLRVEYLHTQVIPYPVPSIQGGSGAGMGCSSRTHKNNGRAADKGHLFGAAGQEADIYIPMFTHIG